MSVGSLEQMYKAHDVVLQALALLKTRGVNCKLTWLGKRKHKEAMRKLASTLHISNDVIFKGNVSRDEVDETLRNTDLFLLVSRTEGLPRALIEAMAMGLPCIGTQVGDSELLDEQVLIPVDDSQALTDKIEFLLNHIEAIDKQASRNYEFAKNIMILFFNKRENRFINTLFLS